VFIARGKEDSLVTLNLVPGEAVKIIPVVSRWLYAIDFFFIPKAMHSKNDNL
jgi:hypothetical protein